MIWYTRYKDMFKMKKIMEVGATLPAKYVRMERSDIAVPFMQQTYDKKAKDEIVMGIACEENHSIVLRVVKKEELLKHDTKVCIMNVETYDGCAVCGKPAKHKCGKCRCVKYCSSELFYRKIFDFSIK